MAPLSLLSRSHRQLSVREDGGAPPLSVHLMYIVNIRFCRAFVKTDFSIPVNPYRPFCAGISKAPCRTDRGLYLFNRTLDSPVSYKIYRGSFLAHWIHLFIEFSFPFATRNSAVNHSSFQAIALTRNNTLTNELDPLQDSEPRGKITSSGGITLSKVIVDPAVSLNHGTHLFTRI